MHKLKPFLKWPGNKYRSIEKILAVLPPAKRLIEPFTGSASVFLNTQYHEYLLGEANADLIQLFKCLQSQGQDFIQFCQKFFTNANNIAEKYYDYRVLFNQTEDYQLKSALMLYLNRHGYNGLCRYNRSGIFNVPFGRYVKPYFPLKELESFCLKSTQAEFLHTDFRALFKRAKKGDIIYCDPPYFPLSKTAAFTAYNGKIFQQEDQKALADLAYQVSRKGVPVIISNHDTPLARDYYKKATIVSFSSSRFISCKIDERRPVQELLAIFHG